MQTCSTFCIRVVSGADPEGGRRGQHLLAPIKKRVHNGAVKSRGKFN